MKLTGEFNDAKLKEDVRILWLYGPEDHRGVNTQKFHYSDGEVSELLG